MKLICPSCGAVASAEAWISNADARQCMRLVTELPGPVARCALSYIALFRARVPDNDKGFRGLAWSKALRLIGELKRLVDQTQIQWKGKPARRIDSSIWGAAMERMIERPPRKLPIDSHGYLTSIAYEMADEMDREREVWYNRAERNGSIRKRTKPNYYSMARCRACGTEADNIAKGSDCPYCGETA